MSKIISSPIKRYPGTVVLADPLTFPQSFAFEDALAEVERLKDAGSLSRLRYALLPGLLACVEEWHLASFPERPALDNFPSTPRLPVTQLIDWLVGEVSALYRESEEVPLAS